VGVFVSQSAAGVRVAVTGAKGCAFREAAIEAALSKAFTPEAAKSVKVSSADVNGDMHGTAEYRAAMISVMASRAVAAANAR
jgi:aerobic carbon-monoxide dehydrogenase medium subunit